MGAGHDHGASNANAKTLGIALGLTTTFLVAEVVAGLVFNSLALLSDAAHMFTDAAALAIALAAIRVGRRKPTDSFTFGYRRFEILAAAFNAILLSPWPSMCWSRGSSVSSIPNPSSRPAC